MKSDGPIILVVGARPNFMKIAPLYRELENRKIPILLLHTGQHYDENMSKVFFDDLGMPEPDIYLGIGSGSHATQTAKVMIEFEKICNQYNPPIVVVVGDVNSTVACSIVCAKLLIKCAHVESGLRSHDREMPEEINRIITDSISNILFTPSYDGNLNLEKEGVPKDRIYLVGNIMIDSLHHNVEKSKSSKILENLDLKRGEYSVLTLHRPSNVDNIDVLMNICGALEEITKINSVVFPSHPRTTKQLKKFDLFEKLSQMSNLHLIEPCGYIDFMSLVSNSHFVMTDSGGLQEETTALGIPCLTIRENTERPITITEGTNTLVGSDSERIISSVNGIINNGGKRGKVPKLWDGKTAIRITNILETFL